MVVHNIVFAVIFALQEKQFSIFPHFFVPLLPKNSSPVCRSVVSTGRKVRATQGTILPNGKLFARAV